MRVRIFVVLLLAVLFVGCDDDIPAGLTEKLQQAVAGRLLGCPEEVCTGTDELSIEATDTAQVLRDKFNAMKAQWCPNYTMATEQIPRHRRGEFSQQTTYTVSVSVIGQVTIRSNNFNAVIEATDPGWKVEVNHTHQPISKKPGSCPANRLVAQCKVSTKIETRSQGEISISWTDQTGVKTASASGNDVLSFSPATSSSWCAKAAHGLPLECGPRAGTGASGETPQPPGKGPSKQESQPGKAKKS